MWIFFINYYSQNGRKIYEYRSKGEKEMRNNKISRIFYVCVYGGLPLFKVVSEILGCRNSGKGGLHHIPLLMALFWFCHYEFR